MNSLIISIVQNGSDSNGILKFTLYIDYRDTNEYLKADKGYYGSMIFYGGIESIADIAKAIMNDRNNERKLIK